ncbi:MAG: hypothetical protein VZS44_04240 [Bacilli bacterium]|nr:hypothetical protein [Bacilli bacterium]
MEKRSKKKAKVELSAKSNPLWKHRKLFSFIYFLITTFLFLVYIKYSKTVGFSWDLMMFFYIFDIFILCNLLINKKTLYNFMYRKRYWIGFVLLSILVIGKYNGSSVPIWNDIVQPEYRVKSSIIYGSARGIRSDEWLVSTPMTLSQATPTVNFATYNKILGAHKNLVMLYPNLPSKDISILATPNKIGYFFLDVERAFSLAWYLPYFIMFFATFEMFMILLNKNKFYSLLGTIIAILSPAVQWWQNPTLAGYGALAVVLFYYFLITEDKKKKLLLSVLFGYSGYLYILILYPAWQVPYGYVFLLFFIWIIINNKDKVNKKVFLYLIPTLMVIIIPLALTFYYNRDVIKIMTSTVYPGGRDSSGGGADYISLFTYVSSIFFPFKLLDNPCEISQYMGLFPIPVFLSIYYMIKARKKDLFLIMCNILMVWFCLWVLFPLPNILSKITLMYTSTVNRTQVVIGYLSLIIYIYILANYHTSTRENLFSKKRIIIGIISVLSTITIVKLSNKTFKIVAPNYLTLKMTIASLIVFSFIIFLTLCNDKKGNNLLGLLLILLSIETGLFVSPINKGLSVFYDKPLAKEIKKMVKEDKNSIFMSADKDRYTGNYLVVNGAKTIDSVNYVPNLDLYHKLDPKLKYNEVYNRFEHVGVQIIEDKNTYFELIYNDYINMFINKSDVCKIGVDYLVTSGKDLSNLGYEKIYNEYDAYIFKTNC